MRLGLDRNSNDSKLAANFSHLSLGKVIVSWGEVKQLKCLKMVKLENLRPKLGVLGT